MKYVCLLRGINVGGKNKVSMAELRTALEEAGFDKVSSYINSGNVFLETALKRNKIEKNIETLLPKMFKLDSERVKVSALSVKDLQKIVNEAPENFGAEPGKYHSDVIFPMDGITSADIMAASYVHPEVDAAWEQNGVVYYRRLSARRTSSRLGRIVESPVYKSLTIRSWNTTVKLLALLSP